MLTSDSYDLEFCTIYILEVSGEGVIVSSVLVYTLSVYRHKWFAVSRIII